MQINVPIYAEASGLKSGSHRRRREEKEKSESHLGTFSNYKYPEILISSQT